RARAAASRHRSARTGDNGFARARAAPRAPAMPRRPDNSRDSTPMGYGSAAGGRTPAAPATRRGSRRSRGPQARSPPVSLPARARLVESPGPAQYRQRSVAFDLGHARSPVVRLAQPASAGGGGTREILATARPQRESAGARGRGGGAQGRATTKLRGPRRAL